MAAKSGTVIIAGRSTAYGNYVVINHGGGLTTLYAHMSKITTTKGLRSAPATRSARWAPPDIPQVITCILRCASTVLIKMQAASWVCIDDEGRQTDEQTEDHHWFPVDAADAGRGQHLQHNVFVASEYYNARLGNFETGIGIGKIQRSIQHRGQILCG